MSEAHDQRGRQAPVIALPPGRVPPHNLDAERSLLGGILLDDKAFDEVLGIVKSSDFYRSAHSMIFDAMLDLAQRNEPIDRITVKDTLVKLDAWEAVGGDDYVDLLDKIVPTAANLTYYARIIAEKSLLRRTIETASNIVVLGYEQHGNAYEFIDQAEAKFFELSAKSVKGEFIVAKDLVEGTLEEIANRGKHESGLVGAPSGLEKLDEMTNGFKKQNLVILAARPSMGKTALAQDVSIATAEAGGAVGVFSLEMSRRELMIRYLASIAKVNSKHLETGRLEPNELGRLDHAAHQLRHLPLHLYAKEEVTPLEVRAEARRLARRLADTATPLRLVMIDYLQLMDIGDEADQRERNIAKTTRQLKGLAVELDLPVILLAQLNRGPEGRPDKRPRLSDLRESGAIEQDADLVIFIYRDEMYDPKSEDKGVAELIIGKQRNGPIGTARVAFVKEYSSFRNLYAPPEQMKLADAPPPHSDEDAPR